MIVLQCDLCTLHAEKPHGGPPDGWMSYRHKREIHLCNKCAGELKKYLNAEFAK